VKRFVNGEEIDLTQDGAQVSRLADRLMARTPEGAFSALSVRQGDTVLVSYRGHQYRVEKKSARTRSHAAASSGELRAPMPGQVVDVRASEGDPVKKGQTLLVLEAMKTQQPFVAPFDGVIASLPVQKGQQVADGDVLVVVTEAAEAT
jgi:biotin carboxyl carrier protein